MKPLSSGPLRAGWADRMLQTDFLHPDAMPIRPEPTPFLLIFHDVLFWLEGDEICHL